MNVGPQEGALPLLALHERSRYRAAADYALRRYPGPVGELIHRELSAYADFGHRFAQDALIPHLAHEVLTPLPALDKPDLQDPAERPDRSPASGVGGRRNAHLSGTGATAADPPSRRSTHGRAA